MTPELAWKVLATLGIPQDDSAFEMGEGELRAAIPPEFHHAAARAFFAIANGLFKIEVDASETRTALRYRPGDCQGAFLLAEQAQTLHPDNPRYVMYMLICAQHNQQIGLMNMLEGEEEREAEIGDELEAAALAGSDYVHRTFGYSLGQTAADWLAPTLNFQERGLVGNLSRVLEKATEYLDEADERFDAFLSHARELALIALHNTGLSTDPVAMIKTGPKWLQDQGSNELVSNQAAWLVSAVGCAEYSAGNLCSAYIFFYLAAKIRPDWAKSELLMLQIESERPGTGDEAQGILDKGRR